MMKFFLLHVMIVIGLFANESGFFNIDEVTNKQTKKSMQSWLDNDFGIKPYRANYILPISYRDRGEYESYVEGEKYENSEAELQVSLQLQFAHNLLGLDEVYKASYTHHAFWQIFIKSAPFRENIYNPELLVAFPVDDSSWWGLRSISVAYAHKSNGQGEHNHRSRSINYFYTTFRFQNDSLITDISAWVPITDVDDNPDLMDYTGYTSIKFNYFLGKNMFTFMGRGNIATGKGALEATYSHPFFTPKVYLYAKIFSGYTESLIDYDNYINKFAIGFSFSR